MILKYIKIPIVLQWVRFQIMRNHAQLRIICAMFYIFSGIGHLLRGGGGVYGDPQNSAAR